MCVNKSKQEVSQYKNTKMNTQCMFIISKIITVKGRYERFNYCNFPSCNLGTIKKYLPISYD